MYILVDANGRYDTIAPVCATSDTRASFSGVW